jgi:hypothetical protein
MRYDKIKIKNKSNVIDLNSKKNDIISINLNLPDSWIIKANDNINSNIDIMNIISDKNFQEHFDDMVIVRNFLLTERETYSFRSVMDSYYSLRHFLNYYYQNPNSNLYSVNYDILIGYINYMKSTNSKKQQRKFSNIIKLLNFMRINNLNCHLDIINKNFPSIKFEDNSDKKIEFYTDDEFKALGTTIFCMINDYFDNIAPQHLFVKSSFWFFAFITGFNMTALVSLKKESLSIIKETDNTITYMIIGEKNRSNSGYQKALIEFNKNSEQYKLFTKVLNELIEISEEVSKSIAKASDKGFLFLSYYPFWYGEQLPDKKKYFRYDGKNFKNEAKAKLYFSLNNIGNISLSTRKIRNQYSISLFNFTKSEKIVQESLNHKNISTTLKHYMKYEIQPEMIIRFKIFQELMVKFSKSEDIDWSIYQQKLGIKNKSLNILISELKSGIYDTPLGNCLQKINDNGNICDSYINCFNCSNYSMIADKDLWKLYSFKENILELKKDSPYFENIYKPIIELIDNFIKDVDKNAIDDLKIKIKTIGKHPFWKNKLLFENMTANYEDSIICKQ